MPTEVILPKWGLTMEVGTLVAWLKQEGERIEVGEMIAKVETEEVTNELEAPVSEIVSRLFVAEGTEEIEVGTVLCIIEEDKRD